MKLSYANSKKTIVFLSATLIAGLAYQNCAKVKFNRDIASETPQIINSASETPTPATVNPDPVPVEPTVIATTTTTTTTLPPIIAATTTTTSTTTTSSTTTIPNLNKLYSGTVTSDLILPQMNFKFIIDNSLSMKLNNTNISQAIGVMFNQSGTSKDLSSFDVTGEVYTTAQNTPSATYANPEWMFFDIYDSRNYGLDSEKRIGDSNPAFDNSDLIARFNSAGSTRPLSTLPGDVFAYGLRETSDITKWNGSTIPAVDRMMTREIYPMPVSDVINGVLIGTSSSKINGVKNYNSFVTDIQRKLSIVSPDLAEVRLTASGDFGDTTARGQLRAEIVHKESGLCGIARLLKEKEKKLSKMSAVELTAYNKNTARDVFLLVSDEDDEFNSGEQCIDTIIRRAGTSYRCETVTSWLNYSVDSQSPNTCTAKYPASFQLTVTKSGTDTIATYKVSQTNTSTQQVCDGVITTNELGTVCSTGYRTVTTTNTIAVDAPYAYRRSGVWTGTNCTLSNFGISSKYGTPIDGSLTCVTENNVNNGSANPLNYEITAEDALRSGAITASDMDLLFSGPDTQYNCPASLVNYLKTSTKAGSGSPSPNAGYGDYWQLYDPSQYTYTNCKMMPNRQADHKWATAYLNGNYYVQVADQTECDTKFRSECDSRGFDIKFCKGVMSPGTQTTRSFNVSFIKKDANPITSYSCSAPCTTISNSYFDGNFSAYCSANTNQTILDVLKTLQAENILQSNGYKNTNVRCNSFNDNTFDTFGGTMAGASGVVYSGSVPTCQAPYVLRYSALDSYANPNGLLLRDFVTGSVDNNNQPIIVDPATNTPPVLSAKPAKDLKTYILDATANLLTKYQMKTPVIKALVKMPTTNPTALQTMQTNSQSVGLNYIDLVNRYQTRFGNNFASVSDLIESGTQTQMTTYYGDTFKGLTDQIKQTIEVALPITPVDNGGQLIVVKTANIESITELCIYTASAAGACVVVAPTQYRLMDLNYNGQQLAHIVVKGDMAMELTKGSRFAVKYRLKP